MKSSGTSGKVLPVGHNQDCTTSGFLAILMEGNIDGTNCVSRKRLEYIVKHVVCGVYSTGDKRLAVNRDAMRAPSKTGQTTDHSKKISD